MDLPVNNEDQTNQRKNNSEKLTNAPNTNLLMLKKYIYKS